MNTRLITRLAFMASITAMVIFEAPNGAIIFTLIWGIYEFCAAE